MGTSTSYRAPTDPQWRSLKSDVTRATGQGALDAAGTQALLGKFVARLGGPHGFSTTGRGGVASAGGGGGRQPGTGGRSRASGGVRVARGLGEFASVVLGVGLDQALRDLGLGQFVGRSAKDVARGLVDALCGDGSTLDEVDARNAMVDLQQELLEGAETYEDVKARLEQELQPEALGQWMLTFFGHYVFHRFQRAFFEKLVRQHGHDKAVGMLNSIRLYIRTALGRATRRVTLVGVGWAGAQGLQLATRICEQTLRVFER